jgi:phage FluMu protein Com
MMELRVTLDFSCCGCDEFVQVTVQCKGKGFAPAAVASVNVPCPTCATINQLSFEADGTVRSVRPLARFRPLPEPSLN